MDRAKNIRLRTALVTGMMLATLILYFIVAVSFSTQVDWVDLIFIWAIQIIGHTLYFGEGELFGRKDETFINNQKAYNNKAELISANKKQIKLAEYCKYEYTKRCEEHKRKQCDKLGIVVEDLEKLSTLTKKEFKKLVYIKEEEDNKIYLTRYKRKILKALLFKEIPEKEEKSDTILSANTTRNYKGIEDKSKSYKISAFASKITLSFVVGLVLAYIGYTTKDTFSLVDVVRIFVYLTTLTTTIVMSFSQGEKNIKDNKNTFYIDLSTYIDKFNEWLVSNDDN